MNILKMSSPEITAILEQLSQTIAQEIGELNSSRAVDEACFEIIRKRKQRLAEDKQQLGILVGTLESRIAQFDNDRTSECKRLEDGLEHTKLEKASIESKYENLKCLYADMEKAYAANVRMNVQLCEHLNANSDESDEHKDSSNMSGELQSTKIQIRVDLEDKDKRIQQLNTELGQEKQKLREKLELLERKEEEIIRLNHLIRHSSEMESRYQLQPLALLNAHRDTSRHTEVDASAEDTNGAKSTHIEGPVAENVAETDPDEDDVINEERKEFLIQLLKDLKRLGHNTSNDAFKDLFDFPEVKYTRNTTESFIKEPFKRYDAIEEKLLHGNYGCVSDCTAEVEELLRVVAVSKEINPRKASKALKSYFLLWHRMTKLPPVTPETSADTGDSSAAISFTEKRCDNTDNSSQSKRKADDLVNRERNAKILKTARGVTETMGVVGVACSKIGLISGTEVVAHGLMATHNSDTQQSSQCKDVKIEAAN